MYDTLDYSDALQGKLSTITVGLDLTKPNDFLPLQRNKFSAGRQIHEIRCFTLHFCVFTHFCSAKLRN
jgi:hypothetical protein